MSNSPVNTDWRAILYGLILRRRGDLATDEIAYLVAERYPHTAARLKPLIDGETPAPGADRRRDARPPGTSWREIDQPL